MKFGTNRDEAATLIKRANTLTFDEFKQLAAVHAAARIAAWDNESLNLARLGAVRIASAKAGGSVVSLIGAAFDAVASSAAAFSAVELKAINGLQSDAVFTAIWHAALAVRVKDLISEEEFDILSAPWRSVVLDTEGLFVVKQ